MYYLASLTLLLYLSLARGHPLGPLGSGKVGNIESPSLQLDRVPPGLSALPNPYHVPGKPYSLLFTGGEEISRLDVRGCLSQAYKLVMQYIELGSGKKPLRSSGIHILYRSVVFSIAATKDLPAVHPNSLTFDDAREVLDAFWLKSLQDGYQELEARINHDQGGSLMGMANLFRRPQSPTLSTRDSPRLSQANRTLGLGVLPNPYAVPGKPFSMDWVLEGDELPRVNVRGCLSHAYSKVRDHVVLFGGDDPLPTDPRYLLSIFLDVGFSISRAVLEPPSTLSYGDAIAVLEALWLKGDLEGYRSWLVNVVSTADDRHIGDLILWKYPSSRSDRERKEVRGL
ncbi:MAG: hypothetical protein LQ349_003393 [Xanthoria aureola]|nr:MAG: hypothetical protein LQ349_003393 [Xanthoria aureola]